jgi:hypothetical protein
MQKNKVDGPSEPVLTPLDTSALNIPVSSGQIGLIIDTRPIAKKGYTPAYISLSVTNGQSFSFSDDHVEVDGFTNLVIWRIPKDSISEKDVEQFAKGVPVTIKIYDKEDVLLAELKENSLPVSANTEPILVETLKPKVVPPLKIMPGTPYVIQAIPNDNYEEAGIWTYTYQMIDGVLVGKDPSTTLENPSMVENPFISMTANYIKTNDQGGQFFTFEPAGNDSTFYIRAEGKKKLYVDVYQKAVQIFTDPPQASDNYKFILSQDEEGAITIKSHDHYPINYNTNATLGGLRTDGSTPVKFRLFPVDIEWAAQNMGISYDQPIMPPAQLDFAVATTINNCGAVKISQIVEKKDTRSTTITASAEESFSVTAQHEARVDMSISMGVNADLFGVAGMSRDLTLSAGYTFTHSEMKTNTSRFDTSRTETTEVGVARTVEVPPYTSVDTYDAVQTYRNVVVFYVQKIRVSGKRGSVPLTGDEIVSQLVANQFGGVVTEIGDTYVTISVRGKVNVANLMATQTDSKSRPCGG